VTVRADDTETKGVPMPRKRRHTRDEPNERGWLAEPPGTVSVVFPDGSGLVRSDGSEHERRELRALLREQFDDDHDVDEVATILLDRGLTIARHVDPELAADPRVMSGDTMVAIADLLSGTN
jgi:hypothetical protein